MASSCFSSLGLLAASSLVIVNQKTRLGLDLKGGVELVYQGQPTPQTPMVTQDALSRAVDIMRQRVDAARRLGTEIQTTGSNLISVRLPDVKNTAGPRTRSAPRRGSSSTTGRRTRSPPNGKTVASQLQTQDQHGAEHQPGAAAADREPPAPEASAVRRCEAGLQAASEGELGQRARGPQYYMFGAPGSAACATAAQCPGNDAGGRPALPALRARRQPSRI